MALSDAQELHTCPGKHEIDQYHKLTLSIMQGTQARRKEGEERKAMRHVAAGPIASNGRRTRGRPSPDVLQCVWASVTHSGAP